MIDDELRAYVVRVLDLDSDPPHVEECYVFVGTERDAAARRGLTWGMLTRVEEVRIIQDVDGFVVPLEPGDGEMWDYAVAGERSASRLCEECGAPVEVWADICPACENGDDNEGMDSDD